MECKHVFHFCISRAILYIIFPMSLYYQNTRTRPGNFPIFLFMAQFAGVALHVTDPRLQKSAPVFSRTESMWCQTGIGATGVFIVTSARSRNGTMKHDAMLHYASFDVKLPNSIYSDYVISVFSYIIRFSLFLGIAYIIWLILHIARLYYWVKAYY